MDLPAPTEFPFTALPVELYVGTDPEDSWTQVLYDQHLVATHEPEFGESTVRAYLLEHADGHLDVDQRQLRNALMTLHSLGYAPDHRYGAPLDDMQWMGILTFTGNVVPRHEEGNCAGPGT